MIINKWNRRMEWHRMVFKLSGEYDMQLRWKRWQKDAWGILIERYSIPYIWTSVKQSVDRFLRSPQLTDGLKGIPFPLPKIRGHSGFISVAFSHTLTHTHTHTHSVIPDESQLIFHFNWIEWIKYQSLLFHFDSITVILVDCYLLYYLLLLSRLWVLL